ncbi:2,3-diphosphoglycerate-dependent phosphoglycerate mutase GpmB [soil metagenome]
MRLWLIRHGETEHNLNGVFQGQLDTPLTDRGREQANATGRALAVVKLERIYASDLQRAHHTALVIAEGRNVSVELDVRLRELHYGVLQGVAYGNFREVLREHGVGDDWGSGVFSERGDAPPEGESLSDLVRRIDDFLSDAIHDTGDSSEIAVVTHGGTIRTIMTELLGMPAIHRGKIALANCGVTCFSRSAGDGRLSDDGWTLEFHNRVFWAEAAPVSGAETTV